VSDGELTNGPQIDLAGVERRNRLDDAQIFALREPQARQLGSAQAFP
jgi:hypothetical protein